MEAGEHVEARLVRPPPTAARLVRPPPRKAGVLVGASIGAARKLPLAWALLAAARLLRAAGWAAPMVVAAGAFRHALAATGDPIHALVQVAAMPAVWLSGLGFTAAALVAAAVVEVAAWSVGLPGLRQHMEIGARHLVAPAAAGPVDPTAGPGITADGEVPLAQRFASLVQTAALLLLAAFIWAAAALPLIVVAGRTWLASYGSGQGGAFLASLGLALVLALTLIGGLLLRLVAEASVARVGAFGERTLPAIYEAAALVLRRPLVFLTALYLLGIASFLAALAFGIPAALAPPGVPSFVLHTLVEIATAGFTGLLALARLGVFVGAASDMRRP